jgi:hypothetical protein
MSQELAFTIFFACGIILAGAACARAVLRLRLPWRDALMWFGVIAYPDEATYAGVDVKARREADAKARTKSARRPAHTRAKPSQGATATRPERAAARRSAASSAARRSARGAAQRPQR